MANRQKRPQVPGRFEAQRSVDRRTQTLGGGRVGVEAKFHTPQVHHRLAEISAGHDERVAERRAARAVPGDSVSPPRGPMKVSRRGQHIIGRTRRLEPGFGEQVAAVKQELGRRLTRRAIGAAPPMGRPPAHRVKIGRVEPSDVHEGIERQENAPLGEFADPGKVHCDNIVSAGLALRVAKRLLAKLVDRKRAQMDRGADHLLELPLQIVHHHERRIGVSEDPESARQGQNARKDARRIDVHARAIVPQEIILVGNARLVTEMPAGEQAHAARHGGHSVHKLLARVN